MKKILFISILALCFCNVYAQKDKNEKVDDYKQVIEKFFTTYQTKGPDIAIADVYATNTYMAINDEQLTSIKLKLMSAVEVLGKYCGYEEVRTIKIGNSFVTNTYMVKYLRQPLYFTFRMYKAEDTWQIQGIRFDDQLSDETIKELINKTIDN